MVPVITTMTIVITTEITIVQAQNNQVTKLITTIINIVIPIGNQSNTHTNL